MPSSSARSRATSRLASAFAVSPAGSEAPRKVSANSTGCGSTRLRKRISRCSGLHRRQRTETEAHLRRGRDHVRLDAALDATDVEAQAGETTEPLMRLRRHEVQRRIAPAHRLMQRAVAGLLLARGVPGVAGEAHQHRLDAAMRQHRLALGGLGHDHRFVGMRLAQEAGNATRIVGLFVGGEQQRQRAGRWHSPPPARPPPRP